MAWVSPAMDDAAFAKLTAIEPGIPPYMRPLVVEWVLAQLGGSYIDSRTHAQMSLAMKTAFPSGRWDLAAYLEATESDFLVSIADWLLYHSPTATYHADTLQGILDSGRSEWTVSEIEEGRPRISRRIPEGVESFLADTVEHSGPAGSLLTEAFNAIHGTVLNPDHAYGLCVKAVEMLACPKYLPRSTRATLSQVFIHLESKSVSLPLREANVPDGELVAKMMRKLFNGAERHGSETYQHVSLEGAKTGLALAAALLSMLNEDLIEVS